MPSTSTTVTETPPTSIVDFGPVAGEALLVAGVAHDDVLNMRSGPGVGNPVVLELAPTARDVIAAGTTVDVGSSFWILVEYSDEEGWVNFSFVAYEGGSEDATATVLDQLGGVPSADSMEELGTLVAGTFASAEPQSDIVMVVGPSASEPNVVVFDVIGLGDDSVRGFRLTVIGEESDGGFVLVAVDAQALCGRGVHDGLCV